MTDHDPEFDHDPDAPHLSELDPDTEVLAQAEDGTWVSTTVAEVLDAEETGSDLA